MNRIMKLLLILPLLLLSFSAVQAQITAVPDVNFENKLIQLGIDSDGQINGQMLTSDATSVQTLDLTNESIRSLKGIEAFSNLTTLDCDNNDIDSIDLTANTNLEYLYCVSSNIKYLGLGANSNLKYIYCGNNPIVNLDVTGLPNLDKLICFLNDINTLDLRNNTALVELDCYNSYQLSKLYLGTSTQLTTVRVDNCSLDSLDFSANTNLQSLYCSGNPLVYLNPPSQNSALQRLIALSVSLSSIDVSNLSNLRRLNIQSNNLSLLDLSQNVALREVSTNYSPLREIIFSNNPNNNLEVLSCNGCQLTSLDLSAQHNLLELRCFSNFINDLQLSPLAKPTNITIDNNPIIHFAVKVDDLAYIRTAGCPPNLTICINDSSLLDPNLFITGPANFTESCFLRKVEGQVVFDTNNNCSIDATDIGASGVQVCFNQAATNTVTCFSAHNNDGSYAAFLDTGWYTVDVILPNAYWQNCTPPQQIYIDSSGQVQLLDWILSPIVNCPYLEVDIAAPFLRMTGGGSTYTISYCNLGTIAANNAYVEVEIDPDLNVTSTSLPIVNQLGNTYQFSLDTVAVGQCGNFTIQVVVDTSAVFEQTHCSQTHIYPDSICLTSLWNGAILEGDVTCQNDSIYFNIYNRGAAMLQAEQFIVIEDDIAMRSSTIQLGAGQSTTIIQPAQAGSTYRIEINQELGFPKILGDPILALAVEGCNPYSDGTFKTGYITQFYTDNSSPFIAVDCQQNIASYDPNDKQAQPKGYGPEHYIYKNTRLDYRIRFQNTGTDTAFNVVIYDTLSAYLDITSLQMGVTSHPYTWTIVGGNVLKVSFPDIKLVDSVTNEPLSHGFFTFQIDQVANNPLGAIIENRAAIYFDFNPAILTNTTFHEIGENFLPINVSIDEPPKENLTLKAYPNPFKNQVTFELEGSQQEQLQLIITDTWGRVIDQVQVQHSQQIHWQATNLVPGVYFFQISNEVGILSTGKLMAD